MPFARQTSTRDDGAAEGALVVGTGLFCRGRKGGHFTAKGVKKEKVRGGIPKQDQRTRSQSIHWGEKKEIQ